MEGRDGGDGGAAEGAVGGEPVLERGDLREAVPGALPPLHDWGGPPGEAGAGTKGTICLLFKEYFLSVWGGPAAFRPWSLGVLGSRLARPYVTWSDAKSEYKCGGRREPFSSAACYMERCEKRSVRPRCAVVAR